MMQAILSCLHHQPKGFRGDVSAEAILNSLASQPEGFRVDASPLKPRSRAHVAVSVHKGYRLIESDTLAVLMDGLEFKVAADLCAAWNTAAKSEVA
jgi:hypothetical protein